MIDTTVTNGHADAATIRESLGLFHRSGDVVEIRIIGRRKPAAGYFDDFDVAASAVAEWSNRWTDCNIYFTINPPDPVLLARSANHITEGLKTTTSDNDITRRRWLLIDADPVRPAGIGASDDELKMAAVVAEQVRCFLAEMLFPEPVEAKSGNGRHLLYPIDLPNDADSTALVNAVLNVLNVLKAKFSTPDAGVDAKVGNASRITKLYGTYARKGDDTIDRPHRRSEITYIPDGMPDDISPTPRERLEAVAAMLPKEESRQQSQRQHTNGSSRLMVDRWLADRGVEARVKTDGNRTIYEIECPFNPEHSPPTIS